MTNIKYFQIENGILQKYFGKHDIVTVPEGVTRIGGSAFLGATLHDIKLPSTLTSIGWNAFEACANLQNITIPDSVTSIEERAFLQCKHLQNVRLPKNIKELGTEAFRFCESLIQITLPEGLEKIGAGAFGDCLNLETLILPESLTSIGNIAFKGCKKLRALHFPDALIHIGNYAFSECTGLQALTFGKCISAIGMGVFYGCTSLQNIVLPDNIQKIASGAFPAKMPLRKFVLVPNLTDAEQAKLFFNMFGTDNLTYPFLLGNLDTNETVKELLTARITNKKFRTEFISDMIKRAEPAVIAGMLTLLKKIPLKELDGYIESSENSAEIRTLLLQYKNNLYPTEILDKMDEIQFEKDFGLREKTLADYKESFSIKKENDTYVITNYKGTEESAELPAKIRNLPVRYTLKNDKLRAVSFEYGTEEICARALYHCRNLKDVTIPESVTRIAEDALPRSYRLTIHAPEGSYAETYAKVNRIPFKAI
ncbi:MAG: leucine-rich repeat protein [Clostridia bacterium]|nr:leucine-rich repeat protein [Clostridia bacterium]